jgi:hypothetical protein
MSIGGGGYGSGGRSAPGPGGPASIGREAAGVSYSSTTKTTITEEIKPDEPARKIVTTVVEQEKKSSYQVDAVDVLAWASSAVAIAFAIAMIVGKVQITAGTIGIVTFAALPTAIFGTRAARRRRSKKGGGDAAK